ncbi:heme o synthase [Paenibacillus nicotianae]|uniref:Protoheme IX farnesyltransferase n=1 Tax=Paenibacillus nicotianae TaxID=1526551 RepID=A0ABW4UQ45_9BACL
MDKQISYQTSSDSTTSSTEPSPSDQPVTWRDFVTLAKPGILRSNLIATFGGFWLASGWNVDYIHLLWTLLGTMLVMASSCVFNNYFDRELDTKMIRTQDRILATRRISPSIVLWYAIILGILGLSVLTLFSGLLAAAFGVLGMVVYVIIYTLWLKRSSTWSTSLGGISGAMPPVIGYVAVTNHVDLGAWLLFAMLFLWQPPHFWALGIRRVEEYRAAGYPLLPVVKGIKRTKYQMLPYIALLIPIPILMYMYNYTGIIFMIVSLILSVLWFGMAVAGFSKQDNDKWAKTAFIFSINYLTISFIMMIIDTVHKG